MDDLVRTAIYFLQLVPILNNAFVADRHLGKIVLNVNLENEFHQKANGKRKGKKGNIWI